MPKIYYALQLLFNIFPDCIGFYLFSLASLQVALYLRQHGQILSSIFWPLCWLVILLGLSGIFSGFRWTFYHFWYASFHFFKILMVDCISSLHSLNGRDTIGGNFLVWILEAKFSISFHSFELSQSVGILIGGLFLLFLFFCFYKYLETNAFSEEKKKERKNTRPCKKSNKGFPTN